MTTCFEIENRYFGDNVAQDMGGLAEIFLRRQRPDYEEIRARLESDHEYVALREQEQREREARQAAEEEESRVETWKRRYFEAAPVTCAARAWNAENTPGVTAVNQWLANGCKTNLILRGGVGCGKTSAACVAVKSWTEPVRNRLTRHVAWLRPDQLVSAVMHSYDENAPKLRDWIVLDDIGRESKSDFVEAFCELLDMPDMVIIGTTNLTKQQIRERYDARLVDRLNDSCIAIDLPGRSLRRQDGGF